MIDRVRVETQEPGEFRRLASAGRRDGDREDHRIALSVGCDEIGTDIDDPNASGLMVRPLDFNGLGIENFAEFLPHIDSGLILEPKAIGRFDRFGLLALSQRSNAGHLDVFRKNPVQCFHRLVGIDGFGEMDDEEFRPRSDSHGSRER